MAQEQITVGEFIFYRSLNGDLSIYKVLGKSGKDEYEIQQVNFDGNITYKSKKFTTTLKDKNGKQRLFRIWLQPEDRVKIVTPISNQVIFGRVSNYLIEESTTKKEYTNQVEIISDTSQQYIYSFDEAKKIIDLV